MTKRKDIGKRKGGLFSRVKNWALGELSPELEKGYNTHGSNVTSWPEEYDDTPLSGDRYVNGKCCRTVGEYKAACVREYGP